MFKFMNLKSKSAYTLLKFRKHVTRQIKLLLSFLYILPTTKSQLRSFLRSVVNHYSTVFIFPSSRRSLFHNLNNVIVVPFLILLDNIQGCLTATNIALSFYL